VGPLNPGPHRPLPYRGPAMGFLDRIAAAFRRSPPEPPRALPEPAEEAAARVIAEDIVARADRGSFAAAAPVPTSPSPMPAGPALPATETPGRPGFSVYGGYLSTNERNAGMTGTAKWTRFAEMVRNRPAVGAPLRRYLELVGAPKWTVPAYKPRHADAATPEDQARAEFAEDQLANLATPWPVVVMAGAMSRWNGAAIQVWTAKPLPDGRVGLADIADRPMHTIEQWYVDEHGAVSGVGQRPPQDSALYTIPRGRMVYSRDLPISDRPDGDGIFRMVAEAVRELEALFKQLHQGLETDLGGIPVVYAPIEALKKMIGQKVGNRTFTDADFTAAISDLVTFARNHVRTKETGLVLDSGAHKGVDGGPAGPPLYKVEVLSAGGKAHDALLEAIKTKLWEIAIVTGFEYLYLGADGSGSLAMAKVKTADAYRLIAGFLNAYAITIQRDVLRPLWALNGWDPLTAPTPTWDRLEFGEIAEVAAGILGPLTAAGIMLDRSDEIVNAIVTRTGLPSIDAPDEATLMVPGRAAAADAAGIGAPRPPALTPAAADPTAPPVAKRSPIDFGEET